MAEWRAGVPVECTCGYRMDACTGVTDDTQPADGAVTVCAMCARVYTFDSTMAGGLRPVTRDERAYLMEQSADLRDLVHIVLESTNPRQALQLVRDRRAAR